MEKYRTGSLEATERECGGQAASWGQSPGDWLEDRKCLSFAEICVPLERDNSTMVPVWGEVAGGQVGVPPPGNDIRKVSPPSIQPRQKEEVRELTDDSFTLPRRIEA